MPDAVCQSVSETFEQTQDRAAAPSRAAVPPDPAGPRVAPGPEPLGPDAAFDDPFLTRPRLLRILFTPWQDEAHDLHAGGYVYIRVEESQWVLPR